MPASALKDTSCRRRQRKILRFDFSCTCCYMALSLRNYELHFFPADFVVGSGFSFLFYFLLWKTYFLLDYTVQTYDRQTWRQKEKKPIADTYFKTSYYNVKQLTTNHICSGLVQGISGIKPKVAHNSTWRSSDSRTYPVCEFSFRAQIWT